VSRQKINVDGDIPSGTALEQRACEIARDRLSGLLPPEALEQALTGLAPEEITGPGGLITQLAGRVVEAALGAELSEHLGYPPGQGPPGGAGNHRNGSTPKTLKTELGEVVVRTPRDRQGSFEPRLVSKRQTRLAGLDERVLDLYAGGMSVRDIAEHLRRLYGVQVGRDTISRVTDAVLEDIAAWRARPLEAVYPIVYFDALHVKMTEDRSVRTRACYLAVGVTCDGDREALGIWWQDAEGAKFWLAVLNDLAQRGVSDVLIACVDGLTGFPKRSRRCSPRPGFRPASCTRSAPRCATSTTKTSASLPPPCGRSTGPPTPTPPSPNSRPSRRPGASATR
jgi:putative transposase